MKPWLIWSNEHHGYWLPNRHGYTARIEQAGRYTTDEAMDICNDANAGLPFGTLPYEMIVPSPELVMSIKYMEGLFK